MNAPATGSLICAATASGLPRPLRVLRQDRHAGPTSQTRAASRSAAAAIGPRSASAAVAAVYGHAATPRPPNRCATRACRPRGERLSARAAGRRAGLTSARLTGRSAGAAIAGKALIQAHAQAAERSARSPKNSARSCTLGSYIRRLRERGKPEIVATLEPYLDAIAASERPRSTLTWAETRRRLLDQLLAGEIALTHEALDAIPASEHPPRTIAFLRAGLVHAGVLGERDEILTTFTKWTQSKLSTLERTPDRALISAYASWDVARGLAQRTSKTGRPATRHARSLVIEAINLTNWLHTQELTLEDLHQDLLDEWVAAGTSRRRWVRLFVIWLKRNGACGELHVQRPQTASPTSRWTLRYWFPLRIADSSSGRMIIRPYRFVRWGE